VNIDDNSPMTLKQYEMKKKGCGFVYPSPISLPCLIHFYFLYTWMYCLLQKDGCKLFYLSFLIISCMKYLLLDINQQPPTDHYNLYNNVALAMLLRSLISVICH